MFNVLYLDFLSDHQKCLTSLNAHSEIYTAPKN